MSKNKAKQFTKLLDEGKLDEAKKFLQKYFAQEWSAKDKGEYMVKKAMEFMTMRDELNKIEIGILEKTLPILEKIDKKQKRAEESAKLSDVKKKIQEL